MKSALLFGILFLFLGTSGHTAEGPLRTVQTRRELVKRFREATRGVDKYSKSKLENYALRTQLALHQFRDQLISNGAFADSKNEGDVNRVLREVSNGSDAVITFTFPAQKGEAPKRHALIEAGVKRVDHVWVFDQFDEKPGTVTYIYTLKGLTATDVLSGGHDPLSNPVAGVLISLNRRLSIFTGLVQEYRKQFPADTMGFTAVKPQR